MTNILMVNAIFGGQPFMIPVYFVFINWFTYKVKNGKMKASSGVLSTYYGLDVLRLPKKPTNVLVPSRGFFKLQVRDFHRALKS